MDQILDTPISQDNKPGEYAGFWIRVAAFIIDYIIVMVGIWIVAFILADLFSGSPEIFTGAYLLAIVGVVLYYALMESSEKQATFGKMAVGIKVGDQYGKRISFANALGRYFSKIISALTLYIGFMMVGWDDRKQGLHDKIADTYVFYK